MHYWSDLIAGIPATVGILSGIILAFIGLSWAATAIAAFALSVITMVVVLLILKRQRDEQITTTVNHFILK